MGASHRDGDFPHPRLFDRLTVRPSDRPTVRPPDRLTALLTGA